MSEANQLQRCDKCGAVLSGYGVDRLCAACLLESAILQPNTPGGACASAAPLLAFNDYELLEEIARGGMGVVYRARQISLNRPVAIKLMLGGHLANAADMKRFRAEAETAAQLHHPTIVAIHEVGDHEGQPFFSMELVAGRNLAQVVRDEPLPARKAAAYLKTIAEAVQYAHSRGVLHRDLKPSNILIDEHDQPRITDFGLAKRLQGDASLTITGQVLGSPSFIPPEQAAGQKDAVGPASDVYSLGAILYQLLTGRPPFVAETMTQTLRMVAENEPVSPRLLNASVPRDLETICLKCLEKRPSHRYPSAQALSEDLNRFLNHEPTHARPVSLALKVHRWCVRNKPLAIAGTAILTLLLVVAIGSPIAAIRINRERRQAQEEAAKSRQVARLLEDILNAVGPSVAQGSDTKLLREILGKTADLVVKDLTNQPRVEIELRGTMGQVYNAISEYAEAEEMLKAAITLCRKLPASNQTQLATLLNDLAMVLWRQGKFGGAREAITEALDLGRRISGDESLRTRALALNTLATLLADDSAAEAEPHLREALVIQQKLLGTNDPAALTTQLNLAYLLMRQQKTDEAETTLRAVLVAEGTPPRDNPTLTTCLNLLAGIEYSRGHLATAETMYLQSLEIRRKIYPKEHADIAQSLSNVGRLLVTKRDFKGAERFFTEALAIRRKLFPKGNQELARNLNDLGELQRQQNRLADAEESCREAWEMRRTLFGEDNASTFISFRNLCSVLEAEGKFAESENLLGQAVARQRTTLGNDDPAVVTTLMNLAEALRSDGKNPEAEAASAEALKICLGPKGRLTAEIEPIVRQRAEALHRSEKSQEAEKLFEAAISTTRLKLSETNLVLGALYHDFGKFLHYSEAKPLLAVEEYLKAVRIYRLTTNEALTWTYRELGDALVASGRPEGAQRYLVESLALYRKFHQGEDRWGTAWPNLLLGDALYQQHKLTEAERAYQDAVGAYAKCQGPDDGNYRRALGSLARTQNDLARRLATDPDPKNRDGSKAVVYAEKAVAATSRTNDAYLDTLAAAYAEAGRFTNAIEAQQDAIILLHNDEQKRDYVSRLKLYQKNLPHRDN